jgi:peroxiredoxin Q/BCP
MESLKEGDKAPMFMGKDKDGKLVSSEDYKGKKLILYFYPKDNTPGCTAEACDLQDNLYMWNAKGYEIVGISPDSASSHVKFAEKYNLKFTLISDEDKAILKKYQAWGKKKMYGKEYEGVLRKTYVISEEGVIEKVFDKVKTKEHTKQIIEALS